MVPTPTTFEKAQHADLSRHKIEGSMAFMFETRFVFRPTKVAMETAARQHEYYTCWQTLKKNFKPGA